MTTRDIFGRKLLSSHDHKTDKLTSNQGETRINATSTSFEPTLGTSSSDSDDSGIEESKEEDEEEVIVQELSDLYHVFLYWTFSDRKDVDYTVFGQDPDNKPSNIYLLNLCFRLSTNYRSTRLMKLKVISDLSFFPIILPSGGGNGK